MSKRRTWTLGLPLVLLLVATDVSAQAFRFGRPESVGMSTARLEKLTDTFNAYVESGQLPGGVVFVARRGRIAYQQAFGFRDLDTREPMEEDDIFRIASQTKALVSVGIMMLQEDGELLISHPVGRYMPEFAETTVAVRSEGGGVEVVPADRPITVRDLLTHTAGVGYGGGVGGAAWAEAEITGWYFAHLEEPVRATVARMAELPFPAQPGEGFVYGYSTDILGALIEVVSGKPLDTFLQERIFEPLGMVDTHFYLPPEEADRLAVVYRYQDGLLSRAPDLSSMAGQGAYLEGPRTSFSGGAGLLSTASDYGRFLQMMLNGGELGGARVLSPKSVQLMTVNHVGDLMGRANGFGLGFQVTRDLGLTGELGSVGSYGWGGAYHSVYWVDPAEDLVVAYMTQVAPAAGLDDQAKLRALIYQAVLESGPAPVRVEGAGADSGQAAVGSTRTPHSPYTE